jgi:cytochrome c-type biogenesis protein CcmF
MLFLGVGQRLRWRRDDPARVLKNIPVPLVVSLVLALALANLAGSYSPKLVGALFLALWVVSHLLDDLRSKYKLGALRKTLSSLTWWGMLSAHMGVAVLAVGIGMSSTLTESVDVRMEPGTKVELAGYEFEYDGTYQEPGPNYLAFIGEVYVWKDGYPEAQLYPEKRRYQVTGDILTEAGIDVTFTRDLFVSMGEQLTNDAWSVNLQVKPFISWIWLGSILMALGGLIAVLDRRYRVARNRKSTATSDTNPQGAMA